MESNLPKRVAELREYILDFIPYKEAAHRRYLAEQPFPKIMKAYVNYATRLVMQRPRNVVYLPEFWSTISSDKTRADVKKLHDEIERGEDLFPRLSPKIYNCGFDPLSDRYDNNGKFNGHKWADKDFALNAYGVHHLHLKKANSSGKRRGDSNEIVFVEFTRDTAVMIIVGDHDSFDSPDLEAVILRSRASSHTLPLLRAPERSGSGYSSKERNQLARAGITTVVCLDDGRVVIGATLSTAGTSRGCTYLASQVLRSLYDYDPIVDRNWIAKQFDYNGMPCPEKVDLEWMIQGTNLLLHEKNSGVGFNIYEGPQGYVQIAPPCSR